MNVPVDVSVEKTQVKARLHTLEYIYDNSRLVLNTEQIKSLWSHLGPDPAIPAPGGNGVDALRAARVAEAGPAGVGGATGATPGEVSTLLSWLSKACEACEGEGGGGMFEPGVAAELFRVRVVCCVLCVDGRELRFFVAEGVHSFFSVDWLVLLDRLCCETCVVLKCKVFGFQVFTVVKPSVSPYSAPRSPQ